MQKEYDTGGLEGLIGFVRTLLLSTLLGLGFNYRPLVESRVDVPFRS